MKRLFTFALGMLCLTAGATDYHPETYQYTMEYTGTGRDENVLVTVTFMCESPAMAENTAKAMAVHGVLFLENAPHPGTSEQFALVKPDAMTQEAERYFDRFFSSGTYGKYVTGAATSKMEIAKVKKMYRIRILVAVDRPKLRKDLENDNIIKSLDHLFKHEN